LKAAIPPVFSKPPRKHHLASRAYCTAEGSLLPSQKPIPPFMNALAKLLCATLLAFQSPLVTAADPAWVAPMRQVHARFSGTPGTFAQFGDSITVTLAFWAPLESKPKNMPPEAAKAREVVAKYQKPECWRGWKGPEFGSNGGMTILWADENVDKWLKKLNPEVAVVMFGSNDVSQIDVKTYEAKTRSVIEKCLKNGTVPILTTMPPRHGHVEKSGQFADAARQLSVELKVPLCDYFAEITKRRPEDWDGALPKFKGLPGSEYEVPTLIARDGVHPSNPRAFTNDFSEEGLKTNGFTLRNYLTLLAYAQVIEQVCQSSAKAK
jgi:lysophospholipase L1-like esterase